MHVKREIEITLTPIELARIFANENSDFQAAFLNELGIVAGGWWCSQCDYISAELTPAAIAAIETLHSYSRTSDHIDS
jgi:hypothetical protein